MRPFFWRLLVCLVPVVLSAYVVGVASWQYAHGEGGFRLGVDLVGGTILVYEIDRDRVVGSGNAGNPSQVIADLAEKLKRRIDPGDQRNVTVRPVGTNRVEIILPTGGQYQSAQEQARWDAFVNSALEKFGGSLTDAGKERARDVSRGQAGQLVAALGEAMAWKELLDKVPGQYPKVKEAAGLNLNEVAVGDLGGLADKIQPLAGGPSRQEVLDWLTVNYKPGSTDEVRQFVKEHWEQVGRKRDFSAEDVQEVKNRIKQAGYLEFMILANNNDDKQAIDAAERYFQEAKTNPAYQAALKQAADEGKPPPFPPSPDGYTSRGKPATYAWVEIGRSERVTLGLQNSAEKDFEAERQRAAGMYEKRRNEMLRSIEAREARRKAVTTAREKGETYLDPAGMNLIYSRPYTAVVQPEDERDKAIEYFYLVRTSDAVKVDGKEVTLVAEEGTDAQSNPSVDFSFNATGGSRFWEVTKRNEPDTAGFQRQLAVILDNKIMSAPSLRSAIRDRGQITGNFTKNDVLRLVNILRSGALPATLKPLPVSENTIGATLGQDTIVRGLWSVGLAFGAVLLFMLAYYRFAGAVACLALFANLLLTVAFMVFFGAAFTLPGLAGLVLMLGMAVDANVLIYERLREERERGANLATAIRNGYDRAFPTIIDTHLSSIFTAIVLYAVGNDQLKGFGISLTAGLVISLFTSLYMTRLVFDMGLAFHWIHKLSMGKLFSRPNIDFMAIRHYWFAATVILTVLGVSVFVLRGEAGLNVDFVGGTAYGGQLTQPRATSSNAEPLGLRQLLSPERQKERLAVASVERKDERGFAFEVQYADGTSELIELSQPAHSKLGDQLVALERQTDSTPDLAQRKELSERVNALREQLRTDPAVKAEQEANIKARASHLPDVSVEQIFLSSETWGSGLSRFFNVRTTEQSPELVQINIDRLLRGPDGKSLLQQTDLKAEKRGDNSWTLAFTVPSDQGPKPAYASPSYVKTLLDRYFRPLQAKYAPAEAGQAARDLFSLRGDGSSREGRYQRMVVDGKLPDAPEGTSEADAKARKAEFEKDMADVVARAAASFSKRPPPERLENFDAQLAADTREKALYAILASWLAILVYLWFRFGSWTFGAAAVVCLIHDLCFTLGIIAFCHYVTQSVPWLASILLLEDFKIDLATVAALLTLVGYSVNDTIVVFDRIREVRGKNPTLTPKIINDSINQTLSRTVLASLTVFLVVGVLYLFGGEGVHLFAFVMVVGVVVGTYSSIYIASPLLLIFGEGRHPAGQRDRLPTGEPAPATRT
jgi:SecD/SecF fusion protein